MCVQIQGIIKVRPILVQIKDPNTVCLNVSTFLLVLTSKEKWHKYLWKSQAKDSPISFRTPGLHHESEGIYCRNCTYPIRNESIQFKTVIIPDTLSLHLQNKITQRVKSSSIENHNRHFLNF